MLCAWSWSETPAPPASLTPHLSSFGDGLYLSWLERAGDGHELRVSRWNGTAFDEARSIHASDRFFANWADFASVLPLGDGRLAAHWLEKAANGTYEYDVWMAVSDDNGRSWSEPGRPHRDGTLSEHGFVSMVALGESSFAAAWLDGREFKKGAGDNEMTLRLIPRLVELDRKWRRSGLVVLGADYGMIPTTFPLLSKRSA